MTDDLTEAAFQTRIAALFADHYGRQRVVREHVYPTERRVDVLVDAGAVTLCVECEDSADSAIEGVGQALLYSNHSPRGRCVPLVVVPDGEAPRDPELAYLEQSVPIFEESELRDQLVREF
jgi:hypothetical protein